MSFQFPLNPFSVFECPFGGWLPAGYKRETSVATLIVRKKRNPPGFVHQGCRHPTKSRKNNVKILICWSESNINEFSSECGAGKIIDIFWTSHNYWWSKKTKKCHELTQNQITERCHSWADYWRINFQLIAIKWSSLLGGSKLNLWTFYQFEAAGPL